VNEYVYQPEKAGDFEKCAEILSQGHRVKREWINNLSPEVLATIQQGFDRKGIPVVAFYANPEGYRQYYRQAGYTERYASYYPDAYRDYLPEKSFEHFIALTLLEIKPEDVFVDVASENSPVPDIYSNLTGCRSYRQDIMYAPGFHGDRIGGNACEMPIPDQFASKVALTCSLEHFEGLEDQKLFFELNRILKVGGKVCVVPLYMYTELSNVTDPTLSVPSHVSFDPGATVYCAQGWGNRFGRFYNVESFMDRIYAPTRHLFHFKIFRITNPTEVDHRIYARFALLATKQQE
jgi:hypothetical protein